MPSESGDSNTRRATKAQTAGAPPPEQEHIPCPRCESTNTKFCYYNNYNFSQPRHFCKSCRRYWTHGGALRDIPVGGGSRKNAKRSRTSSANSAGVDHHALTSAPVFMPVSSAQGGGGSVNFGGCGGGVKVNMGNGCGGGGVGGGFTSLLNTQPGFLALGGFGLGLATGFEEMGFGFGRAVWPFGMGSDGGAAIGANGAGYGMVNAWQFENGETGGLVNVVGNGGGDFCSWPELAISTPGNGLK